MERTGSVEAIDNLVADCSINGLDSVFHSLGGSLVESWVGDESSGSLDSHDAGDHGHAADEVSGDGGHDDGCLNCSIGLGSDRSLDY